MAATERPDNKIPLSVTQYSMLIVHFDVYKNLALPLNCQKKYLHTGGYKEMSSILADQ